MLRLIAARLPPSDERRGAALLTGPLTPRAIAFVHIPKTAGRSIVHAFERALGEDQCNVFSPTIDDAAARAHRFISGHVMLSTVTTTAWCFTFLRDPLAQIASHLRWLDRYNDPVFHEELTPFSYATRALIERVGRTDFASGRSIGAFFEWLPDDSPARLRNVQCEVLAARPDRVDYRDAAELSEVAIKNLRQLEFVGIVERIGRDLPLLFRRLDLHPPPETVRLNTQSSRRTIDLGVPAIRRALAPHVEADTRLYRHVITQRGWPRRAGDRWASLLHRSA